MKRIYITILSVLLVAATGIAQTANDTINRMVLVESTYNPIIVGAVKRNFIPEEVRPSMNKEEVVYADENVDLTNFDREAQSAQLVEVTPKKGTPGYVHLGYGNYNNLSALAAYKWKFASNNDLDFRAHIDGWNGKLKLGDDTQWRSYLYDMGLSAEYSKQLEGALLNIGVHTAHQDYNYLTLTSESTDRQKSNNLGAHIGIKGAVKEHYYYHADFGYTNFSRSNYFGLDMSHAENHIHGEVSLSRDLYQWGMASILLNTDILSYSGLTDYNGYFSLGITPRWEYKHGDFKFVSGFNMDFLGGKHADRPLQMSPECSISYVPDSRFSAMLTLDGGRDINTYKHLYEFSPYWASAEQLCPTYTFLNAHLEGGLRIIEGLHLHLGGGYKILSDALFETVVDSAAIRYTGITNHKAQVATIDGGISYIYKDLVTFTIKGDYYHWVLQEDQALLARAPKFKADMDARIRIMPKFHTYTNLKVVAFTGSDERAIIDWSLGAHYVLNKQFSFFLDAHNLLNHRYSYYTGYPSQGFNILAGAMFKF